MLEMVRICAHCLRRAHFSTIASHCNMNPLSFIVSLMTVGIALCDDAHINGTWSPVMPWPLVSIHATLLKNGKVLTYGNTNNGRTEPNLNFYFDVWDPTTNTHHTLEYNGGEKGTNLFCSGQVQLATTGKVLLTGGSEVINGTQNYGIAKVQIFDPAEDTLIDAEHQMYFPRWYPSVTTLGNSLIVVQGGTGNTTPKRGITMPELYDPNTGRWKMLTGANNSLYVRRNAWWYPKSYSARQTTVFVFHAQQNDLWILDPRGDGSLQSVATVPGQPFRKEAPSCMFDRNKILAIQGTQDACILDIDDPRAPKYEKTGSLRERRIWATAVALPNGEVLVVGGASVSQELNTAVNYAEIWNPTTGQWRVGAEAAKARLYHSSALLLPDATVLVGGGGRPGPVTQRNAEIYSPPYLFQANGELAIRPVITTLSTSEPDYGEVIQVGFADATKIDRVSFIRLGSVTHSFNMDERMIPLDFTQRGNVLDVEFFFGRSVAPPGWYMLFIVDSDGVPSEAKILSLPAP